MYKATRLLDEPIIFAHMDSRMGDNINGPSVVRAPPWLDKPLGRYYLYFADHKGRYIRLAYADELTGPWRMHEAGTLTIERSHFSLEMGDSTSEESKARAKKKIAHAKDYLTPHIASPDVHVDEAAGQVRMYFHGMLEDARQVTRVAVSDDGVDFEAREEILGSAYFRCFDYDGWTYALVMPGQFLRSRDGLSAFEPGPKLFNPSMRHCAVRVRGHTLEVFWTQVGDAPEKVLFSTVDLTGDWMGWQESGLGEVLSPELDWEGANEAITPSLRGAINAPVRQLRDPCLFEDEGRTYLLYCGAGERAIGLAELTKCG